MRSAVPISSRSNTLALLISAVSGPSRSAAAGTSPTVSASLPRLAWTAAALPPARVISATTSSASSLEVK